MITHQLILIMGIYLTVGSCDNFNVNEQPESKINIFERYETLKTNYKKLSEENQKLKHNIQIFQEDLDESQAKVDNLTDELKTLRNDSKEYDLDSESLNKDQIPMRAVFEFSGQTTKIGELLEIDITHCNSSECFTHDIHYEPQVMGLIKRFIDTSSECYQQISFHCHLTPLINSFTGQKLFSWKSHNGSQQWLTSLGNDSCNHMLPISRVDSGLIKEKNLLPITSLSYGPMPYELQSAKVKLGPLTCYPEECNPSPCKNLGTCINDPTGFKCKCLPSWTGKFCEENVDECITNQCAHGKCVDKINGYKCSCEKGWFGENCDIVCPTESNGRVVDGKCYIFVAEMKNYDEANKFCKQKGNARLFEPRSKTLNRKIYDKSVEVFPKRQRTWIGIQWVSTPYASVSVHVPWSRYSTKYFSQDCAVFGEHNNEYWHHQRCSDEAYFICETL